MAKGPEAKICDKVDEWLRKQSDVFCFNVHGSAYQRKGIPDRVGTVGPLGVGFWIEMKSLTGKPSKLQVAIHKKIRRSGGNVRVCYSLKDVKDFIVDLRRKN